MSQASPPGQVIILNHIPGIYDLEVATSLVSPGECAAAIRHHVDHGPRPTAIRRLAGRP